jgi:hypothetical protein
MGWQRGRLRKVGHKVLVVNDGRCLCVTIMDALLLGDVKPHYRFQQQIGKVFRLLKHDLL